MALTAEDRRVIRRRFIRRVFQEENGEATVNTVHINNFLDEIETFMRDTTVTALALTGADTVRKNLWDDVEAGAPKFGSLTAAQKWALTGFYALRLGGVI